jgi:uncharacterized membrane protein
MDCSKGALIATAIAALFAASGCGASDDESAGQTSEGVKCQGINECKGTSECASKDGNTCQGMNECKGQGWVTVDSEQSCTDQGGTVLAG